MLSLRHCLVFEELCKKCKERCPYKVHVCSDKTLQQQRANCGSVAMNLRERCRGWELANTTACLTYLRVVPAGIDDTSPQHRRLHDRELG